MLAVDTRFRKRKIGSTLVRKAIEAMVEQEADEVRKGQIPELATNASNFNLTVVLKRCRSFRSSP